MNAEIKKRVINLLDSYHRRARQIALLRYELDHPARVTENEVIEAMSYARQEETGRPAGHISNKTLYIALNYQDQAEQLNAEPFGEHFFYAEVGRPDTRPIIFLRIRRRSICGNV